MKVKIGSFDERTATELASALKSIGIGVEVKKYLEIILFPMFFVEGRFSELRNKYEETELIDEIKRWKSYLDLAEGVESLEEFERLVKERTEENWVLGILYEMLELNEMLENGKLRNPPKDPIIRFPYNTDEERAKKLDLKERLVVTAEVFYDVFADLDGAIFNEKVVELCEKHDEVLGLLMVAEVAGRLLEKIVEGKSNVDDIVSESKFEFGESVEFRATREAIKEVLECLEEMDLIKIKRGKVFLKR